jgi:hypothetical protein
MYDDFLNGTTPFDPLGPRPPMRDPLVLLNSLNLQGSNVRALTETFRGDLTPVRFEALCRLIAHVEEVVSVAERIPQLQQHVVDQGGQRN